MKLDLYREPSTEFSTPGKLAIDGLFFCYTLEDVVRAVKEAGITAIPAGTYKMTISLSGHFGKIMPLILDVPGFKGVRLHKGNTAKDTEGCILVGRVRGQDRISECSEPYDYIFEKMKKALNVNEPITIEIHKALED